MIYRADGMVLSGVRDIFSGPVNDVLVCQDLASPLGSFYTLLVVKNRETAKKMMTVFERSDKELPDGAKPFVCSFSQNEQLCFVFPYRQERRLGSFVGGQLTSVYVRESICINLVMECLSTTLPYPLLYLALCQEQVNIEKDNSVFFTPYFDLSGLDEGRGEKSCTDCCVRIILDILQRSLRKRTRSYELLYKKIARGAYQSLPELYRDIKITAVPLKKQKLSQRIKGWWIRNKDRLFRLLLTLCVIMVIITLLLLISQIIFGDIPLFRIFENSFDRIGTESLRG